MICLDAPKVWALVPCGHKTSCDECFKQPAVSGMSTCPYCRMNVTGTFQITYPDKIQNNIDANIQEENKYDDFVEAAERGMYKLNEVCIK
jgi:hypothetical protein